MKNKRITGLIALVLCTVLVFSGQGYAADLMYNENDQKWRDLEVQRVPWRSGNDVDNDYYGTNCYCFVDWVVQNEGRGSLSGFCYEAYLSGLDNIMVAQYLNAHHNSSGPSEAQVREAFQKAKAGDVVQMRWSYSYSSSGGNMHTALINGFESDGVYFFQSHVSGTGVKKIKNSFYPYSQLAQRFANCGYRGGFSIYRFGDVKWPPEEEELFPVSQGLLNLTPSKYAKIFTLTSGRYYKLYSDSELTSRLSSSSWTGENDEDYITGVGVNSRNLIYARISYPTSSGRREAYARLREIFVKGTEDSGAITAKRSSYGLYKRAGSGQTSSYGIDANDKCYLLTKENGWCQVMYPIANQKYYRIAWMTDDTYDYIFRGGGPEITAPNTLNCTAVAGSSFRTTLTATGATPITWKISNGTIPSSFAGMTNYRTGLPSGLSISGTGATGTISGSLSHTSDGQSSHMPMYYCFNITATNSYGSSSPKVGYIDVWEPPVFETSSTLATGDVGKVYGQTIQAKGTEFSMRWKIIEGSLPPGLKFTGPSSKRTAVITGTPTQSGYYRFKVQLYNLVGNSDTKTTRWFTITIGNVASEYNNSSNLPFTYTFKNASVGKSYSDWVGVKDTKSGTKDPNNYMFSVSDGELPPGLYIEEKSSSSYSAGMIYLKGVPSKAGTYNFTLKAKRISDGGYNTKSFTMKVTSAAVTPWRNYSMYTNFYFICTSTSPKLRVTYRDYITVNGGTSPYTPSVVSGALPPGMTLEQSGNRTYLTGVPKRDGIFPFTIRITGSNGGYVEKACSVTVVNNPLYKSGSTSKATKPKFSSKLLPDAYVGSMWEATLDASGTEPIAWYAEESLPEWLTLDEATGRIYGIPMEKGKYRLRIKAENELGSVTKTFKVKVVLASPTISTTELPEGYKGVFYETRLEASGTDPIKWSKIGKLPNGLKLDKTLGIISGTPSKVGSFDFTIKAKNKAGSETVQLRIVIRDSSNEVSEKDEEEQDEDEEEDEEQVSDTKSTSPKSAPISTYLPEPQTESSNGSGNAYAYTKLYALIEDEKLEGAINAEAGQPLTFQIGEWVDEYGRSVEVSDASIFVNDAMIASVDISEEGVFTLPGDIVSGEITVYALAQAEGREIKTLEVNAVTGEQAETVSGATSNNQSNEAGNTGGCNFGLLGFAGLIFCGGAIFRRKN